VEFYFYNIICSNGQSEKAVGIIKNMLKKYQNDNIVNYKLYKLNYNNRPVFGLYTSKNINKYEIEIWNTIKK